MLPRLLAALMIIAAVKGEPLQFITARDTLTALPGDSILTLPHRQIISGTMTLYRDGSWVKDFSLRPIPGIITLDLPQERESKYIAIYQYLAPSVPTVWLPPYYRLPLLSDSAAVQPATKTVKISDQSTQAGTDQVSAAGSFYRSVEVSPFGGTDFSGGLRLQLNGQLSDDIQINGILADESIPIQPEGNTRSLEEIDQVFLNISHPLGSVNAGDMEFAIERGRFLQIERRLTGLRGEIKQNNFNGALVVAGNRGNYHQLEFKGRQGNQGPYALVSVTGSSDILVTAGSEKVYVDGELQVRGENHDYTIDYSVGEVFFTPRQLIHADSDILIEYQYSDFSFNRHLLGASAGGEISSRGHLTLDWFREWDNISPELVGLSQMELDSLRRLGDDEGFISGARADSTGEYYLINGVYSFIETTTDTSGTRYAVSFRNDPVDGAYLRAVSPLGRLYYRYLPPEQRQPYQDLYSPQRRLLKPVEVEMVRLGSDFQVRPKVTLSAGLLISENDRNRLSSMDDDDNHGGAYELDLAASDLSLPRRWSLNYRLQGWGNTNRFKSLQRTHEEQFLREWNLQKTIGREHLLNSTLTLENDGGWDIKWDHARYLNSDQIHRRNEINLKGSQHFIPLVAGRYNQVKTKGERLLQANSRIELLPGVFHPFYQIRTELAQRRSRLEEQKTGLLIDHSQHRGELGIVRRLDWSPDTTAGELQLTRQAYNGHLEIKGSNTRGWNYELVFQKQLTRETQMDATSEYELLRSYLGYARRDHPIRWDLKARLEEQFTEKYALVFDSVGTGLGTHRFDPDFNEYVADPNGAFLALSVPIGDRVPSTGFESDQRLKIDFAKSRLAALKAWQMNSNLHLRFAGRRLSVHRLFSADLNAENITKSQWNLFQEWDYRSVTGHRRWRLWGRFSKDLDGIDPRGTDLRHRSELGVYNQRRLSRSLQLLNDLTVTTSATESSISGLRERDTGGWWLETSLKLSLNNTWQIAGGLQGGQATGQVHDESFAARAIGIKSDVLRFIGRQGRIQARIEYHRTGASAEAALPPEALNGLARGESLRILINSQLMIGSNLSANLNASFINDARYDGLITARGEIRAYF